MLLVPLLLVALQEAPAPAPDPLAGFIAEVQQAAKQMEPVKAHFGEMMVAGEVAAFVRQLEESLPEKARPAAHDYALASLLFDLDPARSIALHQRVHERLPDNPLVSFEWALELHRAGRLKEAEAIYASLPAGKPMVAGTVQALHADVLARLGRYERAISLWQGLDLEADGDHVTQALGWAYAPISPWVRRAELLQRVAKGEAGAARELLFLDAAFDWSPLRIEVRFDLMDADLQRARNAPTADAEAISLLAHWARLRRARLEADAEDTSPKGIEQAVASAREAATAAHLLGESPALPRDLRLAESMLIDVIELGLAEPAEVLANFEDELWARLRAKPPEAAAARMLGGLYDAAGSERAAEAWRAGWDGCADAECVGFLVHADDDIKPDDPLLVAALKQHPDEASILGAACVSWLGIEERPAASLVARYLVAGTREDLDLELIDATYGLLELADPER